MLVGLTYDLREESMAMGFSEEETAEFDKPETVEGIESALRSLGYTTDRIGHARSLVTRLTTGYFRPEFFRRFGFAVDQRLGGLVRAGK